MWQNNLQTPKQSMCGLTCYRKLRKIFHSEQPYQGTLLWYPSQSGAKPPENRECQTVQYPSCHYFETKNNIKVAQLWHCFSFKKVCLQTNISSESCYCSVREGWDISEILLLKLLKKVGNCLFIRGIHYIYQNYSFVH